MFDAICGLLKQLAPYLAVVAVIGIGYYVYKQYIAPKKQEVIQSTVEQPKLPPPPPPNKMLIDGILVTDNCPECDSQLEYDTKQNIVCSKCNIMYGEFKQA
jgi:hypothetical protein